DDTLVCLVVVVLAGAVLVFPALALLFRLAVTGRFRTAGAAPTERAIARRTPANVALLARSAVASLIAGTALLNAADAGWAHAIGVVCLFAFVVLGFAAIA